MPDVVTATIADGQAKEYLDTYFGRNGGTPYTGSSFEMLGGDGDTANVLTAEDLIAVSMLAVHVPAKAARALLDEKAGKVSELLEQIPPSCHLETLDHTQVTTLETTGPVAELWSLLRRHGKHRWGIGPTTASKIMARKRPHLIPVYDSVISDTVGVSSQDQWSRWALSLQKDDSALVRRLEDWRDESGQSHLSILRVLDIVLWMHGKSATKQEMSPATR